MKAIPRTEFAQALKAIATERGLDPLVILETIKQAIIAAFRRDARERGEETEGYEFDVELNPGNGEARVFSWLEGKPEERRDVTPPGFGRIAAQTAKQVIHQKIREAEKDNVMEQFSGRVGGIITGMVLRFDGADVHIDIGRTEAVMPASERIPNERLTPNQRYSFLMKGMEETARGKQIILSRADPQFVVELFRREVPEIASESVEIKLIAREPGVRTKMTVFSNQSGVDPVGSCVGQKGVRVQAVTNELGGEKVDIIPHGEDLTELVAAALSPATDVKVKLNKEKTIATVKVPEDQLSLAIGRDGQNARLAAKLTEVKIEIEGDGKPVKSEEESADEPKESENAENDTVKEEAPRKIKESTEEVAEEKQETTTEEAEDVSEDTKASEKTE